MLQKIERNKNYDLLKCVTKDKHSDIDNDEDIDLYFARNNNHKKRHQNQFMFDDDDDSPYNTICNLPKRRKLNHKIHPMSPPLFSLNRSSNINDDDLLSWSLSSKLSPSKSSSSISISPSYRQEMNGIFQRYRNLTLDTNTKKQ